jgi:DNA helicase-2/ATP-dependent DNA helicase PcrA
VNKLYLKVYKASAGSGKTACLISRIEYILKQKLANPYNILAVTFTNRAANEMKVRILEEMKVNLK